MTKNYILKISLALAVGLSASLFTSCKDDADDSQILSPEDQYKEIDSADTRTGLKIVANSNWRAEVVSDDSEWLYLINPEGTGNGTLQLAADYNTSGATREATVRVTEGSIHTDYVIKQFVDDNNGAADVMYANTGLGNGLYINQTSGKRIEALWKSPIFNFAAMGADNVAADPNYVQVKNLTEQVFSIKDLMQYKNEERLVTANLNVNISYGFFKLGLEGNFKMFGAQQDTIHCFGATANYPVQSLTLNYYNLVSQYISDEPTDGSDQATYRSRRRNVMTSTFLNIHDSIEHLVERDVELVANPPKNKKDPKWQLWNQLEQLNRNFGPVFISNVVSGGNVDIDFQVNGSYAADTLDIHGKLKTSFNSLFSLDVEVAAHYFNAMKNFMKGSTLTVAMKGGSTEGQNAFLRKLEPLTKGEAFSTQFITDALLSWSRTIDTSNMTIVEYDSKCIWELFSSDAADVLMEYFAYKYPNRRNAKGEMECPYLVNIQALTDY